MTIPTTYLGLLGVISRTWKSARYELVWVLYLSSTTTLIVLTNSDPFRQPRQCVTAPGRVKISKTQPRIKRSNTRASQDWRLVDICNVLCAWLPHWPAANKPVKLSLDNRPAVQLRRSKPVPISHSHQTKAPTLALKLTSDLPRVAPPLRHDAVRMGQWWEGLEGLGAVFAQGGRP